MASVAEARRGLVDLTRLAEADLRRIWLRLNNLPADEVRDALMALLPVLAGTYGDAAGALGADWYDDMRAEAEVRGTFRAEPAPLPGTARFEALARWGVDPLFRPNPDPAAALVLLSGGMQRTIADAHRLTVVESSLRDPAAEGWRRIGQGDNCGFCNMLIGRGAVYKEATVTFKSHDHCNCIAGPAFDPGRTVPTIARDMSQRRLSDETKRKNNARAYEWIKANQ
jgi:hypothetical protein